MAHWVLRCQSCHREFAYSVIEQSTVEDYFLGEVKPEFPRGGACISCPNCQGSSIYQRTELMYRKDPSPHYFAEPI
jgi:hypothetical protein